MIFRTMLTAHPKLLDWVITSLVAGLMLCLTGIVHGSEQPTTEREEVVRQGAGALDTTDSRQIGQAPDDISRKLDRLEQPKESMVGRTVLDPVLDRWRSTSETLKSETGLAVGIAYTTLYQRLTDKKAGNDPKEGAVGDLDIFGEWSLPGTEADRSWFVGYQAEMRHRLFTSSRLWVANCYSSCYRELINPSTVSLPTEFVQLDWQFSNDASNFSRRITVK